MRLVTGATGLVGGHLLYRFRESANKTVAIYRDKAQIETTKSIFRSYGDNQDFQVDNFIWKKADILDIPSLEDAFTGIDEVYHCAAALEADSFEKIKKVNITGTENLVNVSLSHGIRKFCHVSSISALGDPVGDRPINEEDFFNLDAKNSDYAISKYGAEMEVWRATQEGMDVIIVNPGIILGEGSWDQGSGQLFKKTFEGNRFYTSGSSGYVDIRDVVEIMTILMRSDLKNERFIMVSENENYQLLLSKIAKQFNAKKPSIKVGVIALYIIALLSSLKSLFMKGSRLKISSISPLVSKTTYSAEKIEAALEYKFIPLEQSIERICNYYLNKV